MEHGKSEARAGDSDEVIGTDVEFQNDVIILGDEVIDPVRRHLVCGYRTAGPDAKVCCKDAYTHIMWAPDLDTSFACAEHEACAVALKPYDTHPAYEKCVDIPGVWDVKRKRCEKRAAPEGE